MESLFENKPLLYSLLGAGTFLLSLVLNLSPDINARFEIVEFESDVSAGNAELDLLCALSSFVQVPGPLNIDSGLIFFAETIRSSVPY